jgi:hypothetical protein
MTTSFCLFPADFQAAADYELTIDMKPTGTYNGWTNVFHFTVTGDNCWSVCTPSCTLHCDIQCNSVEPPTRTMFYFVRRLRAVTMVTASRPSSSTPTPPAGSTGSWAPLTMSTWILTKQRRTATLATRGSTWMRATVSLWIRGLQFASGYSAHQPSTNILRTSGGKCLEFTNDAVCCV